MARRVAVVMLYYCAQPLGTAFLGFALEGLVRSPAPIRPSSATAMSILFCLAGAIAVRAGWRVRLSTQLGGAPTPNNLLIRPARLQRVHRPWAADHQLQEWELSGCSGGGSKTSWRFHMRQHGYNKKCECMFAHHWLGIVMRVILVGRVSIGDCSIFAPGRRLRASRINTLAHALR